MIKKEKTKILESLMSEQGGNVILKIENKENQKLMDHFNARMTKMETHLKNSQQGKVND